jgi:hypothetical protein
MPEHELKKVQDVEMLGTRVEKHGDLSHAASAARAKAETEARFIMAVNRPRNFMQSRVKLLEACNRTRFAVAGIYKKPLGDSFVKGPSIRFAEEAAKCWGNIYASVETIYDDEEVRKIRTSAIDLENNLGYAVETTTAKTIERRSVRAGQEVLGERKNSRGDTTFLLRATDDDMITKTASSASKGLRQCLLRLIPEDLIEECMDAMEAAQAKEVAADPASHIKKVCDAFMTIGVKPLNLEEYLGHSLTTASPAEINDLRQVFSTIKDGEATWVDVLSSKLGDIDQTATASAKAELLRNKMRQNQPLMDKEHDTSSQKGAGAPSADGGPSVVKQKIVGGSEQTPPQANAPTMPFPVAPSASAPASPTPKKRGRPPKVQPKEQADEEPEAPSDDRQELLDQVWEKATELCGKVGVNRVADALTEVESPTWEDLQKASVEGIEEVLDKLTLAVAVEEAGKKA